MVEGAGALIPPEEILAGIDFLLAGQREDGFIPDRVQADGTPIYFPGPVDQPIGSQPPIDNQYFMVKLICAYARLTRDYAAASKRLDRVWSAMDAVPAETDGLIAVDRNNPWVEYGFTDNIAKTGKVFWGSLLHWEACQQLAQTYKTWEQHDEAHMWFERAEKAGSRLFEFYDDSVGMYRSAQQDCRQIDVWGSAYATVIRVPSKTQSERIAHWLVRQWEGIILKGYVRHLPADEYWKRLFMEVPPGTYQNGGFWAVPTGWVAQTVALVNESVAAKLAETLIDQFATDGACEWINLEGCVLPGYGASVACLLGAVQGKKS
jgi:glycogen debranching enzyme